MSFEDTNYFFGRAMGVMDVGCNIEDLLLTPDRSVSVKIPLEMDDGCIRHSVEPAHCLLLASADWRRALML